MLGREGGSKERVTRRWLGEVGSDRNEGKEQRLGESENLKQETGKGIKEL